MSTVPKIERTFFDHIAISSNEKIHSSVIAWIFSLDHSELDDKTKSELIKRLFKINTAETLTNFKGYAEYNTIDILITCNNSFFAIENKLKSSEHSNQTNNLVNKVPDNILRVAKKTGYFGYLSLVEEAPENPNLHRLTYSELYEALSQVNIKKNKKSKAFFDAYKQTLMNLVNVFKAFIKNPEVYKNVFEEGHLKKHEKKYVEDYSYQDYIRLNQLETIFQKAYFLNIGNRLELKPQETFKTDESHGTGLLQIYLKEYQYEEHNYQIGLQLQGKTLKINLADKSYNKSSGTQINNVLKKKFTDAFHKKNGYEDFNLPKKTKKSEGKAYLSVSKRLEKELYNYSTVKIVKILNDEIIELRKNLYEFIL
jgi:hypothetical protein